MKKYYFRLIVISIIVLCFITYFHYQANSIFTWKMAFFEIEEIEELKVATYNIQIGKGKDGTININRKIETLQALNADIISLQEVERFSIRTNFLDQVKYMAETSNMNAIYHPSISYPGIYYGNVILSKYPIVDHTILTFSSISENRTAIIAKVQIPNQEIYVINTHLGLNKRERLHAIRDIYEVIKQLDNPVILTGDLNSTPIMNEYDVWSDMLTKSNEGIPLQTYYNKDWQIDYIFHSIHFSVLDVIAIESNASDHYPVKGTFKLLFRD